MWGKCMCRSGKSCMVSVGISKNRESVLLSCGMELINTMPLGSHKTMEDYAKFLMMRYLLTNLLTNFNKGSSEVHLVFGNPGHLKNSPRYFEQARWDTTNKN